MIFNYLIVLYTPKVLEIYNERMNFNNSMTYDYLNNIISKINISIGSDLIAVVQELKILAESGDSDAQIKYGDCCFKGIGRKKSRKQAVEYYSKSAKSGNKLGKIYLAQCLCFGWGIKRDLKQLISILWELSNDGDEYSEEFLDNLIDGNFSFFDEYDNYGFTLSNSELYIVQKECAILGHEQAIVNFAKSQDFVQGLNEDNTLAIKLLQNIANDANPETLYLIGLWHMQGYIKEDLKRTTNSFETASIYFRRAASLGDTKSMYKLVQLLTSENYIEKNLDEAWKYCQLASFKGDNKAMDNFSYICSPKARAKVIWQTIISILTLLLFLLTAWKCSGNLY